MALRVIDILADKHQDWFAMAKSFGVSDDEANELVQQMYVRINDYVDDPKKILYNETEVNTYYVYVTLRNLFLSSCNTKNRSVLVDYETVRCFIESIPDDNNVEEKMKFDEVLDKVEDIVDDWYWYDKKIFNIHFFEEMSMRKIAKDTKISLSSIFNTLSNGKAKIKEGAIEEYRQYRKAKRKNIE